MSMWSSSGRMAIAGLALTTLLPVDLAAQPVVSNVSFVQGDNGSGETQVVITYDLASGIAPYDVSVLLSQDGGVTFPYTVTSVTGDVGPVVTAGTGKTILWDIAADYPDANFPSAALRVVADDSMVSIAAASFEMGDPWSEGGTDELPVHTVSLSVYQIGRYEVTNAEYAAFLNSAMGTGDITVTSNDVYLTGNATDPLFTTFAGSSSSQIVYSGGTFSVRTRDSYPMDDHPVVEASWCGAAAYCNWLSRQQGYQEVYTESGMWPSDLSRNGYHLPTEAQWERAAAWEPGHGHWRYGFTGDTISTSQANYDYANPLGLTSDPYTSPVGHYSGSKSDTGCYDMSGNVWEWCNDWYSSTYYGVSPSSDPEGPSPQTARVLRGGGWGLNADGCRSAGRGGCYPGGWDDSIGFRVSRTP